MTGAEAKKLNNDEIKIELKRLREKLFSLRVQRETEKVENTSQFKQIRRDIARIETERSARRRGVAPAAAAKPPAKPASKSAAKKTVAAK